VLVAVVHKNSFNLFYKVLYSGYFVMVKRSEVKKPVLDKAIITRILGHVPSHEGFHFFKAPGDSTGKTATSLADFVERLRAVDIRSVNFHFRRQDFEKWLRDVVGDVELARRISRIRKEAHGEKLRSEIMQIVKGRLDELKGTQTKS